jgi:hypothetical protein
VNVHRGAGSIEVRDDEAGYADQTVRAIVLVLSGIVGQRAMASNQAAGFLLVEMATGWCAGIGFFTPGFGGLRGLAGGGDLGLDGGEAVLELVDRAVDRDGFRVVQEWIEGCGG